MGDMAKHGSLPIYIIFAFLVDRNPRNRHPAGLGRAVGSYLFHSRCPLTTRHTALRFGQATSRRAESRPTEVIGQYPDSAYNVAAWGAVLLDGTAPAYSAMVHEVHTAFFSYCREDSEFALKLAEDLKSAGAHVWIDQLDIEPGTPWDRAVEDALTNSPRMLVVLSPVSVNSDNVRDEVSFALSRQKRVIPVLYRDCNVPFRLARLQHIDFRPDYHRALKVLLRALGVEILLETPAAHAAIAAAEAVVSAAEGEENVRPQKLEEERKLAAEQAELEAARRVAEEQARQKAAPEKAAADQREAGEEKPPTEKLRREQRAAEQARLEEEARQAEEKARLLQQEQERLAAELRARQEQLRREQQESVERRRLDMAQLEREQRESEAIGERPLDEERTQAAQPAPVVQPPKAVPAAKPAPLARDEASAVSLNFASPKILGGAAVLLVVIGLVTFFATHRNSPQKPQETAAETKAPESGTVQQPPSPAPKEQAPAGTTLQTGQPTTPVNTTTKQEPPPPKAASPGASPAAPKQADNAAGPVRVSQGVSQALLVHQVKPDYPPLARQAHVQGVVVLAVVIAKDGTIKRIHAVSGHPLLTPAAIDAVKQWSYKPYMLNGKPVDVDTTVDVNFRLTN